MKNETTTKSNKSTNNFIIRMWSYDHYDTKLNVNSNIFRGSIQNVQTKKQMFFDSPGDMLKKLERCYREEEQNRKRIKNEWKK